MNNTQIHIAEPVLGISGENGNVYIQVSEIERYEDKDDEYADLPLSEFERNMAKLQDKEKDQDEEEGEDLESIIAKLEENYTSERENIYQSGFEAGVEAGKKEYRQEYQKDINAIRRLIRELEESKWRVEKETELSMLNLALQISRHVIQSDISVHQEKIENVVHDALDYARNLEVIALEMHPEDCAFITRESDILNELPDNINLKKNSTISRGGCLLHTNMETIDARIETKLEQLAEELYFKITEEGK